MVRQYFWPNLVTFERGPNLAEIKNHGSKVCNLETRYHTNQVLGQYDMALAILTLDM